MRTSLVFAMFISAVMAQAQTPDDIINKIMKHRRRRNVARNLYENDRQLRDGARYVGSGDTYGEHQNLPSMYSDSAGRV